MVTLKESSNRDCLLKLCGIVVCEAKEGWSVTRFSAGPRVEDPRKIIFTATSCMV